jgi:hypothetical protein
MESRGRSVTVIWDNAAQTMLRFDFARHWTWPDIDHALLRSYAMIEALPHQDPISMLIVPTSLYIAPKTLSEATRALQARHPRIIRIVLVTDYVVLRNMATAFVRLVPSMHGVYFVVSTLDAARALI